MNSDVNTRDLSGRTALHDAAAADDPMEIERLLDLGVDIDFGDRCSLTALHMAVITYSLQAAEALIKNGAVVDALDKCCIPFFLYDKALGDIVETDDNHNVTRVVERL